MGKLCLKIEKLCKRKNAIENKFLNIIKNRTEK